MKNRIVIQSHPFDSIVKIRTPSSPHQFHEFLIRTTTIHRYRNEFQLQSLCRDANKNIHCPPRSWGIGPENYFN